MAVDKQALTKRMIEAFGQDMDFFYANTHDEIMLHFPFAKSNGFNQDVSGIANVREHFGGVTTILEGWRPYDITVTPFADPDQFLIQYRGNCQGRYGEYEQQYCTVVRYKDDKLVYFCEYWDTLKFDRAWGNAKDAEAAARAA